MCIYRYRALSSESSGPVARPDSPSNVAGPLSALKWGSAAHQNIIWTLLAVLSESPASVSLAEQESVVELLIELVLCDSDSFSYPQQEGAELGVVVLEGILDVMGGHKSNHTHKKLHRLLVELSYTLFAILPAPTVIHVSLRHLQRPSPQVHMLVWCLRVLDNALGRMSLDEVNHESPELAVSLGRLSSHQQAAVKAAVFTCFTTIYLRVGEGAFISLSKLDSSELDKREGKERDSGATSYQPVLTEAQIKLIKHHA